ncbi:MAG: hypothetical protein H0T62_06540 [Parachlamydiaceae bacterium]|nr:hypothetical protein [Parachlamydiaceae bacterium]
MILDSEKILQQALKTPIWQVKKGHGSFLTFDMGEKISGNKKDGTIFYSGSIHLWIYMCDWKVLSNGKEILQSGDDDSTMNIALNIFANKEIVSIMEKTDNIIKIEFTDKLVLTLIGDDYEENDDFFHLYTPVGNVSYNKEFGLVLDH